MEFAASHSFHQIDDGSVTRASSSLLDCRRGAELLGDLIVPLPRLKSFIFTSAEWINVEQSEEKFVR